MSEQPHDDQACMDPRRFLLHTVRVHQQQQFLVDAFARKDHWVFAMCPDCQHLAVKINQVHAERHDGAQIGLVAP
jgi:hypothetical protein